MKQCKDCIHCQRDSTLIPRYYCTYMLSSSGGYPYVSASGSCNHHQERATLQNSGYKKG